MTEIRNIVDSMFDFHEQQNRRLTLANGEHGLAARVELHTVNDGLRAAVDAALQVEDAVRPILLARAVVDALRAVGALVAYGADARKISKSGS